MDLSDVMKTVLDGLNTKPAPPAPPAAPEMKPTTAIERADALYKDICAHVGQRRLVDRKSPIEDGCLRASALSRVLADRHRLTEFHKRSDFDNNFREIPEIAEQLTYDIGHAVHRLYREDYFGPMGRLWGTWECQRCASADHVGRLPSRCAKCGHDSHKFVETLYVDRALRIRGHSDGLLAPPPPVAVVEPDTILEIKSASSSSWDKLTGPEEDHLDQVHVYMHASGRRQTAFVYVDKGKQTNWKWIAGKLRPVGSPRVKVYYREFDERRWADIKKQLVEFWMLYDGLEAA